MVGVEQQSAGFVVGRGNQFSDALQGVELFGLGIELHSEPAPALRDNIRDSAHPQCRQMAIAAAEVNRTHDDPAIQLLRNLAHLVGDLEEVLPLGAIGEHPAVSYANCGHNEAAPSNEIKDLPSRSAT